MAGTRARGAQTVACYAANAARRCVRLGPAASSRSGHYHSGFWFRSSVPRLPHVPDSARLCPAPGRWPQADGGGLGGWRRGAILTYTCREDSITGEDCWTKGDPQPRE